MTDGGPSLNRAQTTSQPGDVQVDGVYRALAEPLSDRLFAMFMHLATELWTVRDRLRLVERALDESGTDIQPLLDEIRARDEYVTEMRADRDAFIARVLSPMNPGRARDNGTPPL